MVNKIELLGVDDLIPYVNNARTHSDEQVLQIASSIKEFGFNNPILIDKDKGIIAGHGRLLAAKKLGLKEVPTICLDHLSDAQRKAYILADNRIALNSAWNVDLLKCELLELNELNVDLNLLGFSHDELLGITEESEIETDVEGMAHKEEYGVLITLKNEKEQQTIFEELESRGFECKIMN
jgi:ParB-like chromosome segregation protein Spo0J